MTHSVTIHQLTSPYPSNAYLNVETEPGHIAVWCNAYFNPTYLLTIKGGSQHTLIQFDNEEFAKEYLKKFGDVYDFQRLG